MTYQVLARKWRPKRFADLVGQEHVVRALSNALIEQRLHHAYLLTGTRGVGKTTIARILAKSLNCETGVTAEPCGVCGACRQIDAGRFVDLLEIDAASNTGIDNIREVLDNAQYSPSVGRFKVYIIDEVHMLSKSAFNAMLKTLEEPPAHVKFILATTDPQKVPVTVLSRCLQFSLRNMTPQQVAKHLAHVLDTEQLVYEPAALTLLGRAASGSMRDALSLLDQAIAYGIGEVHEDGVRAMLGAVDRRYLFTLLAALADGDGPALMAEAEQLAARSIGFDSALHEMAQLLYQISLTQTVPAALAPDEPEREAIIALAELLPPADVQLYYQIAITGRRDLALAPDEHAGFNMTLLRMLAFHPANLPASPTPPAGSHAPVALPAATASPVATSPAAHPEASSPLPATRPPASPAGGGSGAQSVLAKLMHKRSGAQDAVAPARTAPAPRPAAAPSSAPAAHAAPPAADCVPPWEDAPPPPPPPEGSLPRQPAPRTAPAEPERPPLPSELPPAQDTPWISPPELTAEPEPAAPPSALAALAASRVAPVKMTQAEPLPLAAPTAISVTQTEADTDRPAEPPVFSGNWGELIAGLRERLGAKEIMLAQNAELSAVDGATLRLRVPPQFRFSASAEVQALLAATLGEALGQPVTLDVTLGDISGETPFMQQQRLRGEALDAARARLQQDPVVMALVRDFAATLRQDTIQPVQESL